MSNVYLMKYALALLVPGLPAWAAACDAGPGAQAQAAPAVQAQAMPQETTRAGAGAPAASGLGDGAAPAQLERARGGAIASETTLGGVVSGNSATHVATGANTIEASSFAGATGIPIVIQNTGANVLIQNATVINLQFK